ncbi:MAG: VCBS repeat-containing protein [Planctomycetes bacterium]|nr:VCBS repeat-containing protein [Planctomycetota bacterium]
MAQWNKRHRLLFRWSLVSGVILIATIAWALANRKPGEETVLPGEQVVGLTSVLTRDASGEAPPFRFRDVTAEAGIAFRHFPATRASLLPEDMGSGVAVGDYDGDGYSDLYFVNIAGSVQPGAPQNAKLGKSRLYRNIGSPSADHGTRARFVDVTDEAGVGFVGCGMGAAWGDYDNDGDLDLYVTAFGENVLYQNQGDGTFRDVTQQSGTSDARFSTGCAWADYDRDGDLDLYVSNYVDFVFREADRSAMRRQYDTEQPYTLNPSAYAPQPNSLFRNRGDGTFEEVAAKAGVADPGGRSLSVSWGDWNNDGWPDLYVANDVSNNGVFRNNQDGTFADVGASSLAADYRGAMGIAVADVDDDLDLDLLITHWIAQENALFRNMTLDDVLGPAENGRLWFMDHADEIGLGQSSLDMVGWATGFCDFDNDGLRDLWLVNGSTFETAENHRLLHAQLPFVFWNRGPEKGFVDVASRTDDAGGRFRRVWRGLSLGAAAL